MSRFTVAIALSLAACVHEVPEQPFSLAPLEVDPVVEAAEVERMLTRAGFTVRVRIAGRGYVALFADRATDPASAVRVVTKLGTMLGVDAPDHASPLRTRVALLEEASGRDLDGDGTPEVLIALDDDNLGRCIAIARVLEDGRVFEVPLATSDLGPNACAEEARDVLGDARPELLVRQRAPREGRGRVPRILVPFVGRDGLFSQADTRAARGFYESELEARTLALAVAEQAEDADEVSALRAERTMLEVLLAGATPVEGTTTAP